MSARRRPRPDLSDRACLLCQRRKTRCVTEGNNTDCNYCTRTGQKCDFREPLSRTPLTRRNLDAAESRCRALETQLRRLRPTQDPEPVLEEVDDSQEPENLINVALGARPSSTGPTSRASPSTRNFEWHETFVLNDGDSGRKDGRDGMASLAAATGDSGYLGKTSGSSLLETLRPFLQSRDPIANRGSPIPEVNQAYLQDPNFAFSHHLSSSITREYLINAYFHSYNVSYPIIHERTFRDQYSKKSQIPANSTWHILYYIILAIGEWISGQCHEEHSLYYEAARSRLRIEALESGTVSIVQAFLLLGNYLQKRDRPNTGYNFTGIAYRVALGLGLHREISSKKGNESFALERRRLLFWTLYCFESGFSITTGRPILVSDSFIDIRKPRNIDDSQCDATSNLPPEADYPTTGSAIIAQARLAVIANKVYNDFLSTRTCTDVNYYTAIAEQSINNWRSALPSFFTTADVPKWFLGPRQIVLWKEANLRILLLLAGERQHVDEHDKAAMGNKCQSVAIETIFDIANFCQINPETMHLGLSWYAVYFLLQANLALGIYEHKQRKRFATRPTSVGSNTASGNWETAVTRTFQCLEGLGPNNKAAIRTMRILHRLFQNVTGSETGSERCITTSPAGAENVFASMQSTTQRQQRPDSNFPAPPDRGVADFNIGESPTSGAIDTHASVSTNNMIATDFVEDEWVATVDPSLHMFLDNVRNIDEMFHGVEGFPSTNEHDNFSYMTSSMHTFRTAAPQNRASGSMNESNEAPGWLPGQRWYDV